MLIKKRCTICHDDVEVNDRVTCDTCGNPVHERCAAYQMAFECPRCADEPEIGALEF